MVNLLLLPHAEIPPFRYGQQVQKQRRLCTQFLCTVVAAWDNRIITFMISGNQNSIALSRTDTFLHYEVDSIHIKAGAAFPRY
jgi:hypothetical protein